MHADYKDHAVWKTRLETFDNLVEMLNGSGSRKFYANNLDFLKVFISSILTASKNLVPKIRVPFGTVSRRTTLNVQLFNSPSISFALNSTNSFGLSFTTMHHQDYAVLADLRSTSGQPQLHRSI